MAASTNEAWARQLRVARDAWEERHRRKLSYPAIGKRVAVVLGMPKAYSHTAVSAWFEKGTEPRMDVVRAILQVLEADPADFRAILLPDVPTAETPVLTGAAGALLVDHHTYTAEERRNDAIQAERDRAALAGASAAPAASTGRRRPRKAGGDH